MATKVAKKSTSKAKSLTPRQETEREQLEAKIEHNELRLSSGLALNGLPLTPGQIETTRQILTVQRDRLQEIERLIESVHR